MTAVDTVTGELVDDLLSPMECSALTFAEATIERGLASFVEVGEALAKVRDERLYRADYGTFEDYCRERWNLTASYARDLIGGSAQSVAIATVEPDAPRPSNLGQARALVGLEPDVAAKTMKAAHEATGGKVTAKAIKSVREALDDALPEVAKKAVEEFPDLAFHYETGRLKDVVVMADDLRRFRQNGELDMRLDNLRRSVCVQKAKRDGTYEPGTGATLCEDGVYRMRPLDLPAPPLVRCPTCDGSGQIKGEVQ